MFFRDILLIFIDLVGLGGQVDGYYQEHAAVCMDTVKIKTYEIKSTLTTKDLNLSQDYINTFKPKAFLKVWIR